MTFDRAETTFPTMARHGRTFRGTVLGDEIRRALEEINAWRILEAGMGERGEGEAET